MAVNAVVTAVLFTTGVWLLIGAWQGRLPEIVAAQDGPTGNKTFDSGVRLSLAVLFAFIAFLVSRWPVAGFFGAVAGWQLPLLSAAKKSRKATVARVEAIAVWVESLRDLMAGSAGLQEAIRASADIAPAPIQSEVRDLALRLRHEPVSDALRRFTADLKHPLADMVAASLILASSRHAGSLRSVLAMTAKSARDTAALYREVEAGRTQLHSQSRLAGGVSFLLITSMVLFRRDFLSPFDSIGGQVALFVVFSIFLGSATALYRLGKPVEPRRLFEGIEHVQSNSWAQR